MAMFCPLNGHVLSMILLFAFLRTLPCVLNKLDLSMLPGALNKLSLSTTLPFVLLSGALNRLSLSMTLPFVLLSGSLNRFSLSVTSVYFASWSTTVGSDSLENNSCNYLSHN